MTNFSAKFNSGTAYFLFIPFYSFGLKLCSKNSELIES